MFNQFSNATRKRKTKSKSLLTASKRGVAKYQQNLKMIGTPLPVISLMFLSMFAIPENIIPMVECDNILSAYILLRH